ncbi:MAG: ABC transporter permease [Clostridia bacterium]|nr:ABC transporter permease [Clostridia bacterium]
MTKNLVLDFVREIRHSLNRFLSIICIVAIGVAVFAGLRSAPKDMSYTLDNYYDRYNIMDLQILSTLGLTDNDIEAIESVAGVKQVQPGYFADAMFTSRDMELVARIHSLPQNYLSDPKSCINQVEVVDGRLPTEVGEIAIERSRNVDYKIQLGDTITFSSGTDTPLTDGTLKTDTLTVVGFLETPYYLTFEKGNSQINGQSINMFAYVPYDTFAYEDVYIEALVTLDGALEKNTFSKSYAEQIKEMSILLKNIGTDRSVERGNEIRAMAQEQLDAAQKQYDDGLNEFNTKIAEGEKQLEDAYNQLMDAEKQLAVGQETFDLEVANAEKQIADGEKELAEAAKTLDTSRKQLAQAESAYKSAKESLNLALENGQSYLDTLKQLESLMGSLTNMIGELNDALQNAETPEEEEQYREMLNRVQSLYDSTKAEYNKVKNMNAGIDGTIAGAKEMLAATEDQLNDAKRQLAEGEKAYADGKAELAAGKKELAEKKEEYQKQLEDAQKQIADGWEEYEKGKEELETQRAEGEATLQDARDQLIGAEYQIQMIEDAEWYMLDRGMTYGFASYDSTVKRMDALSQIMPLFFILVAVLVCMTTMTRMVNEQRGIIGTYKALGYENNAIASKYVLYVTAASGIGGIIGAVFGVLLFPWAVYSAWAAMYAQPDLMQKVRWGVIIVSFLVSVVAMAITAYYTCRVELKEVPAQLLRPKAPKLGKAIFLEKMPKIWSRLNFSQKVTMRNIFRYKKRLFMTVIGIMGCTALLLAGLGMNDTISTVTTKQYGGVFNFDFSVSAINETSAQDVAKLLDREDAVTSYAFIGVDPATVSNEMESEIVTMYVTATPEHLRNYISLQERTSGKPIELTDDGIVLSEKLAEEMNVKIGDYVDVVNTKNISKSIPVIGITENYVFHYAYMSQAAYESYYKTAVDQNGLMIKTSGTSEEIAALKDELTAREDVVSLADLGEMSASISEQIEAMKSILYLIIAFAALLAFVVLYNLTNINVSERIREIATIKVLGFKKNETAMYIYRENFILTLMGAIVGLAGGVLLHRAIMKSIEQSNIMFGFVISLQSYILAVILTCVFSILVMLYMYKKIVNIPMVESLKSVE